jgi:4-amino-4-deoxy-L-arabinose transferase-like glycosyltransferase
MTRNRRLLLLSGVLAIASFLRFYHLASTPPGLSIDEAMDGVNAQNVAQTGQFKVYYPEDNGREGLYVNILALAFRYHLLPDTAPWSLRIPAAVSGVLAVLGVYLLVAELFTDGIALLSAFLLATSFWHINFSRIGFRAILAPFCLSWAMYFLLKALRGNRPRNRTLPCAEGTAKYLLCAMAGGVFYGLGFYTYIAFRITPLLLPVPILFFRKEPAVWKCAALFLIITFLVALPIGWYYLHHPADFFGRTAQVSVTRSARPLAVAAGNAYKTALMFNWHGDRNWRHNVSRAPQLFWPVGIFFILGIILGAAAFLKRDSAVAAGDSRFAILFMVVWFILGALPEVLSDAGIPHALRAILMVVPATIFAAIGAFWIYRRLAAKLDAGWMAAVAACFLAFLGTAAYRQYFISWAGNPNVAAAFDARYVAIGNQIKALPPSAEKYVVVAGGVLDYGIPSVAESVLYVTHSFVPSTAAQKHVGHIHFLLSSEIDQIPSGTAPSAIFEIR